MYRSKRSHPKMVAFMFVHSSKSLIENINIKQWELNEHLQLKKPATHTEAAHVKSLYLHTGIT